MPPAPEPHPSAKELSDFGLGKLPRPVSDSVAAHLERCSDCLAKLTEQQPDSFMGRLRAATPRGDTEVPTDGDSTAAPRKAPPPPGFPAELAATGKFEDVRKLGEGGMGAVWKARHTLLDKDVAIKVMNSKTLGNADARDRFFTEMRAGGRLDHPNIARVIDAGREGDLLFLVMEYVEGRSLDKYVGKKGRLAAGLACELAAQAALGLQHAHEKGMAHRDIKPANLMLTRDARLKLLDFGLVRLAEEGKQRKTQFQAFMGTAEYVAPEQATNARSADIRSDVYSLGCTLYFLLSGKPPFEGESFFAVAARHVTDAPAPLPGLPPGLWEVIDRMMAKRPEDRFQTPAEVAEALQPFRAKAASPAPSDAAQSVPPPLPAGDSTQPTSLAGDRSPAARKRPGRRLAVVLALALLAPLGIWLAIVLRMETDHGTLIVEIQDDEVEARIRKGKLILTGPDGKDRYSLAPAERHKGLAAGDWKIRVEGADGLRLDTPEFTIEKRGRVTVRVTLDRKEPAARPPAAGVAAQPAFDAKLRRAYQNRTGRWRVDGDELVQETRVQDCELAFGDFAWADYDFAAEVKKVSGNHDVGLVYRLSGEGRSLFVLGAGNNTYHFAHCDGAGGSRRLSQCKGEMAKDRWYRLVVRIRGRQCECFVDDVKVFSYEDANNPAGAVGVRTWMTEARFRNVRVTDPKGQVLFQGLPTLPADAGQWLPPTRPVSPQQVHLLRGHGAPVTGVAFTRDGRHVLSCSNGETGHVPDPADGKTFFFVSPASTVLLWDRASGRRLDSSPILEPVWNNRAFTRLALAPAGAVGFLCARRVASQSASASVQLWAVAGDKLRPQAVFRDENRNITDLAFSPDGRKARALGLEGGFWEWDLTANKLLRHWPDSFTNVSCGALAPTGRFALLARRDRPFAEIDLETGKETGGWKELTRHSACLAIAPDGGRALEGTRDGEVRLWDVASRRELHFFTGHRRPVRSVAFSPDGERALSGSGDGTVRLWDLRGNKELACFTGHTGPVLGVAFSPDGGQAVSGSADYTVRVWQLP